MVLPCRDPGEDPSVSTWPLLGRVSLSVALIGILAMPAAAFEEQASTGTVGDYVVPDDPGVVCIYEDNPGSAVDELNKVSIQPVNVSGPSNEETWVGFRYVLKANEKPYGDGIYRTVYKSPIDKEKVSRSEEITFTGKYVTEEAHRSDFQVQLVFIYYEPGSKTKVAGKTRGLVEVYRQLGLEAGVLDRGSIGDPGACGARVHG
jgi:hypothetical protein